MGHDAVEHPPGGPQASRDHTGTRGWPIVPPPLGQDRAHPISLGFFPPCPGAGRAWPRSPSALAAGQVTLIKV